MYMLYVVPYIEGDQQDENHIRVQLHHADGISRRHVIINGTERFVRSTSRVCDWQPGEKHAWGRTILVHLKPLPKPKTKRLQCKDLDMVSVLKRVKRYGRAPTIPETLFDNPHLDQTPTQRLVWRKMTKLHQKGYIIHLDSHNANWRRTDASVKLTPKGIQLLEALELAERQDG